jgi:hypothetical protein
MNKVQKKGLLQFWDTQNSHPLPDSVIYKCVKQVETCTRWKVWAGTSASHKAMLLRFSSVLHFELKIVRYLPHKVSSYATVIYSHPVSTDCIMEVKHRFSSHIIGVHACFLSSHAEFEQTSFFMSIISQCDTSVTYIAQSRLWLKQNGNFPLDKQSQNF